MTDNTLSLINEYLTQGGYSPGIDPETLEREAALVAAAPELLAALIDARGLLCEILDGVDKDEYPVFAAMTAAISKAKGE